MIKFFRRIRYELMEKNKTGKYLKYAIGEIVLVVIGILIALSINNWNENKKKKDTVKVYLQNFVEDLKDDRKNMELLEGHNIFRYHSLQHLLKMSGELQYKSNSDYYNVPSLSNYIRWKGAFPEEFNKEFVQLTFEASQQSLSHDLNQSTKNELKSTGFFSFLDNNGLKESINNYYEEWNWRLGENNERLNWQVIAKWEDALADGGITTSDPFETSNSLSILKDYPNRLAILKRLIRRARWTAQGAAIVSKNASDLIVVVQEEINSFEK